MKCVLLIVALLCLVGTASATDYYVSTTGDNSSNGLTVGTAWQNVSYAIAQLIAGDTLYLIDGTWYNETTSTFTASGTAENPIIVTSYNGTPTMIGNGDPNESTNIDGISSGGYSYLQISNIVINNYRTCLDLEDYTNHSIVSNMTLGPSVNARIIKIAGENSHYNTLEDSKIIDSRWNAVQLYGARQSESGIYSTYITVRNNEIYDTRESVSSCSSAGTDSAHNLLDLFGNLRNVTIDNNTFWGWKCGAAIYTHDFPDRLNNITISNNRFNDSVLAGISQFDNEDGYNYDIFIHNNTFENIDSNPIGIYKVNNVSINDNIIINCSGRLRLYSGSHDITLDNNTIDSDSGVYSFDYNCYNNIVKRPQGVINTVRVYSSSNASIQYDDGTIFTVVDWFARSTPQNGYFVDVLYYPTHSNASIFETSDTTATLTPTTYNQTLIPTNAYLQNVTVNTDYVDDVTNISVNSSVAENPTTMTFVVANASNTYNISIDGVYDSNETSSADRILTYTYSEAGNEWDTPHDFEVTWASTEGWSPTANHIYYQRPFTVDENEET